MTCLLGCQGEEMPFNAEEYMGIQFPPLELNSMKLVTHTWTSANYVALLDGLFWSLRPEILSLELNYYSPEFLKVCVRYSGNKSIPLYWFVVDNL